MGMLMSGLRIIIVQVFMVRSAKVYGNYSGLCGCKTTYLICLFSITVCCLILYMLMGIKNLMEETLGFLQVVILSMQILDDISTGNFGTMCVLVTSNIFSIAMEKMKPEQLAMIIVGVVVFAFLIAMYSRGGTATFVLLQ